MSNYVLTRPSFVGHYTTSSGYGFLTSASAMGASGSLGSVREITFEDTAETLTATSTNYNDAVVATAVSGRTGTLTIQLEEITSSAMMLAFEVTASSATLLATDASATVPTNRCITSHPWYIDGSANTMVCTKCNIIPGSVRKVGKEQEILEVKFQVMVDVDASAGKKYVRYLQA